MKNQVILIFLLTFTLVFPLYAQQSHKVEVFCHDSSKIIFDDEFKSWILDHHIDLAVYAMRVLDDLIDEINKDLPNNEDEAKKHLERIISKMGGQEKFKARFQKAYMPHARAELYKVTDKMPSMIIDKNIKKTLNSCDNKSVLDAYNLSNQNQR